MPGLFYKPATGLLYAHIHHPLKIIRNHDRMHLSLGNALDRQRSVRIITGVALLKTIE
ncbi:MAG: hypothetical protein JWQ80_40 [Massilia sp.]|nr:hypothetical protein [Massilia sp.]